MILDFGAFELDLACFELRRGDEKIALEPQVFDVLAFLAQRQGQLVTKNEILDEVWGDRFVSESALTSRIKTARRALGDDARQPIFIRTIHGRGYRFEADVTVRAASPTPSAATGRLPVDRTMLVGREGSVGEISRLIHDARFVSLLGIGGTGKTRLAVAAGRSLIDEFPDGVWFIDLIPAHDRASIETAIAHTLGLASTETIARTISDQSMLLVLDNCEHVLEDVGSILDELLATTTVPRFLSTSREPIGLVDERRLAIAPLDITSAKQLLAAAAGRVDASIDDDELAGHVCERLDGLPLAIELAGAQLRHLSLRELADRLDRRFELLAAEGRQASGRHASILEILDETWMMLEEPDQELLGQLVVFPGEFSAADVDALTQDAGALRGLARLIDRSLVSRSRAGDLRVFETVRLFVSERTDNLEMRRRHAQWCERAVGETVDTQFADFAQARWCLEHYDNLIEAERTLTELGYFDRAAGLIAAQGLAMHTDLGARGAATHDRLERHLIQVTDAALLTRLHLVGVMCGMSTRAPRRILHHGEAAVAAAQDVPQLLPLALVLRSWSAVFSSPDEALELVTRAHELALAGGEVESARIALSYRAFHLGMARRYEEAAEVAMSVVENADDEHGGYYGVYSSIAALGSLQALDPGPEVRARLQLLLEVPSREQAMWSNQLLVAAILFSLGDREEAIALIEVVVDRLDRAGLPALPDVLLPIAVLARRDGNDEQARRWLRAVRDAGRPTQSFQMTVLYDRLRQSVGIADDSPLEMSTLEEIGGEALDWMRR